jgi:hypothetical protein
MLIASTQASIFCQPSIRTLHNPSNGQLDKPFCILRATDDNDLAARLPFIDKIRKTNFTICGISIDRIDVGVVVWVEFFQARGPADAVQDVTSRDNHSQNQAKAVHNQVPLPPVHLLTAVISALLLRAVRISRLAIDARCCPWRWFVLLAHRFIQGFMDARQRALFLPLVKVIENLPPRRKVMWKHSPLTTAPRNIENAIDDLAEIHLPRASSPRLRRKKTIEDFPLGVCRICWVSFGAHASNRRETPWFRLPRRASHLCEPPVSSWLFLKQTLRVDKERGNGSGQTHQNP